MASVYAEPPVAPITDGDPREPVARRYSDYITLLERHRREARRRTQGYPTRAEARM